MIAFIELFERYLVGRYSLLQYYDISTPEWNLIKEYLTHLDKFAYGYSTQVTVKAGWLLFPTKKNVSESEHFLYLIFVSQFFIKRCLKITMNQTVFLTVQCILQWNPPLFSLSEQTKHALLFMAVQWSYHFFVHDFVVDLMRNFGSRSSEYLPPIWQNIADTFLPTSILFSSKYLKRST